MRIESERLMLVPASIDMLRADLSGAGALAAVLGIDVAPDWPPSDEYDHDAIRYMIALQQREPAAYEWGFRYIVMKAPRPLVVGAGGYTAPAKDGEIEIGYSVSPSMRRHGYASECTRALAAYAFANTDIARVIAHTLPRLTPSIGVLEKCGFRFTGPGQEAGTVRYELTREAWQAR